MSRVDRGADRYCVRRDFLGRGSSRNIYELPQGVTRSGEQTCRLKLSDERQDKKLRGVSLGVENQESITYENELFIFRH